jgi:hypothetical protein
MAVLRADADFRFMEESPATFHVAHVMPFTRAVAGEGT